jgi:hypothetical protein
MNPRIVLVRLAAPDIHAIASVDEGLARRYVQLLVRGEREQTVNQPPPLPGLCPGGRIEHRGAGEVTWVTSPSTDASVRPVLVGIVRSLAPELAELVSLRLLLPKGFSFPDRNLIADAVSRLFGRWELHGSRMGAGLHTFGPGPGDRGDSLVTVEIAGRARLYRSCGTRRQATRLHSEWEKAAPLPLTVVSRREEYASVRTCR